MKGELVIVEKGEERRHTLGDVTSIGRSADNQVQLTDLRSSKLHCRITRSSQGYTLIDEGSTNGTRLNGTPTRRALLTPGDVIEIGEARLAYEGDAPRVDTSAAETTLGEPSPFASAAPAHKATSAPGATKTVARGGSRGRPGRGRRKTRDGAVGAADAASVIDAVQEATGEQGLLELEDELRRRLLGSDAGGGEARRALGLNHKLRRILSSNARLLQERNLKRLLEAILDEAVEISGAERGFIILRESDEHGRAGVAAARNIDRESLRRPAEKFSKSIAERVLSTGTGIVSANAGEDPRFGSSMSVNDLQLRSILCVPIPLPSPGGSDDTGSGERVLGVIYVDNRFSESVFREDDLDLLGALGLQAAIALENARLFAAEERHARELAASRAELERLNLEQAARLDRQQQELAELRASLPADETQVEPSYYGIVGSSPSMRKVFETLAKVADSSVPVLIQGESGTGKELVARAIHDASPRHDEPFVSENCAAISETLLESELFGHVRGAFTDAHADKPGLFEVASGGTLFLDEIGDMSSGMQKKLLRVLQEGEVRRVGGKKPVHVDVRVIAASNKRLRQMIQTGEFREDLYYRLNVITLELPPLRERRDDIPLLVQHFLEQIAEDEGGEARGITRDALAALRRHEWPGNVRELENEIRRACALTDGVLEADSLSPEIRSRSGVPLPDDTPPATLPEGVGLKDFVKGRVDEVERRVLEEVLRTHEWRKAEVAERLQISRPTLDSKIERHGLVPPAKKGAAKR